MVRARMGPFEVFSPDLFISNKELSIWEVLLVRLVALYPPKKQNIHRDITKWCNSLEYDQTESKLLSLKRL